MMCDLPVCLMTGESAGSHGSLDGDQHVKHAPEDLVSHAPKAANSLLPEQPIAMVRKIAMGPPIPRYQGECATEGKGPSQKYLEANEVKYFSLEGEGVGDFMVTISLFQKEIGFMLVFTIIE